MIKRSVQLVVPDETRRLDRERVTITTGRRRNIKIVALGSHAS
jgi:hypothetical protein